MSQQVTLHQSSSGQWVPCSATKRACPLKKHVSISGEAQEFVKDILNATPPSKRPVVKDITPVEPLSAPKQVSVDTVEALIRSGYKGHRVPYRRDLAERVAGILESAEGEYDKALFETVRSEVASAYAGTTAKPESVHVTRRIFFEAGVLTSNSSKDGIRVYPLNPTRTNKTPDEIVEGDIIMLGDTNYEVTEIHTTPTEYGNRVDEFSLYAPYVNKNPYPVIAFRAEANRASYSTYNL